MFAPGIADTTQHQPNHNLNVIQTHTIIPAEKPHQLTNGNWKITVVKGEAWIFCKNGNHVLHAGDTFEAVDDAPVIRPLYIRSKLTFTLQSL